AAQADLLAVVHPGGEPGGDRAAVDGQLQLGAQRRVADAQLRAGGGVGALRRGTVRGEPGRASAAEAATLAAEHPQQVLDVGLAAGTGRGARAGLTGTEHRGEDVLEAASAGAALARGEPGAAGAHGADGVVLLTLLGVVEHRVGLADLLEPLLRLGVVGMVVGVVLPGLLAVGLLDLLRVGVLGGAEGRVEVLGEPVRSGHVRLLPGAAGRGRVGGVTGAGPAGRWSTGRPRLVSVSGRAQEGPRVPTRAGRRMRSCIA